MPTTLIHYFSGTGNTARAVKIIAENLTKAGHLVTTVQINKGADPPMNQIDYHIVAFPVLSWAPPVMVKQYLRKMPPSAGAKVAILAINGAVVRNGKLIRGYTGQALEAAERLLKRKKFDVFLTANASFPDNWTQMTNPCDEQAQEVIFGVGEADVNEFISGFLANNRSLYRCGGFNKAWTWVVAGLFGLVGRRVLGTFYMADENCTGCSLCAKTCPSGTIVMKRGKPFWNDRCEDCNRCINLCPEKAIQVSLPLLIVQILLHFAIFIYGIILVLHYTPILLPVSGFIRIPAELLLLVLVTLAAFWITLYPLNAFFGLFQRIPAVRRFLCISYTKKFRRYLAPGYHPHR